MAQEDIPVAEAAPEAGPPPRKAGPMRLALRWLGRLAFLLVLAMLGLVAFLHTPPGRQLLVDQIAAYAPASGLQVEVEDIEGSILWSATLKNVKLRDADGTLFAEVPRVDLGWRPWRWFVWGLDVRHLVLSDGTLHAIPRFVPGDPDAPLLPDFPIRIERLVVEDLAVDPGLLGADQRVIQLRSQVEIHDGKAHIEARGDVSGADRLVLLLDAEPDADAFDLDLALNAPAGGLLATMAGLDKDLALRVTGQGGWSRWQGRVSGQLGGAPLADARLTAQDGLYRLAGTVLPGDLVRGIGARALGREVGVEAEGTLADATVQGEFAIDGAGLDLDGAGGIDLADKEWRNLRLVARVDDPGLLGAGLRLTDARVEALLDGPFGALRVPHSITVGRLQAGNLVFANLTQRGVLAARNGQLVLPLAARVERVTSGLAEADRRLVSGTLTGALLYDLATGRISSRELDLRFPDLAARLVLAGDGKAGTVRITGPVTARGLDLADVGQVSGTARVDAMLGGGRPWTLRAQLDGQVARVANATLANLAGETIRFAGGLSLAQNRPVLVQGMRIDAARLQVDFDGTLRGGVTELAGTGRHADYGAFTFTATLAGDGPRARLLLADPYPPAALRDVALEIAPEGDGFAIDTRGQSLLGPFNGNLLLVAPAGAPVRIGIRHLEVAETQVSGTLALATGGVDGTLLFTGGGVEGRVALAPRAEGQGFDAELAVRDARFGGATPLTVATADVDLAGYLAGPASRAQGTVRAQGIGFGTLFIGRLAANATMAGEQGHIDAALTGRRGSRFDLLLNADASATRVAVAVRGSLAGEAISMPRRAVLVGNGDGSWTLERSLVSYAGGSLVAEGRLGGGAPASGRLMLDKMPLSVLDAVGADLGLGGRMSGVVDLGSDSTGLPTGEARLLVDGLTRSGLLLASRPLDLAAVVRLTPDALRARAVMRGAQGAGGRLNAAVTGLPQAGALGERLYRGALAGTLTYDGPAESLWRLAAVDLFDMSGPLRVSARLRGSLAEPSLTGSLASDSLRVQSQLTGSDVSAITVRGRFNDSRLQLASFAGTTPNGGRVSGSGTLDLSGISRERGPAIDVRLAADNARILQLPGMAATVTGPLRVVSDGTGGTIAGRLLVRRAQWRLGRAAETVDLPDIAITEVNRPLDTAPPRRAARPWRYLIDATAPGGVEVDGMGLDSEWSGAIRLRGTTADPRIGGTVRIVPRQGYYTFAGSRFAITRGVITFDEATVPDPRLDILAESDESGVDVAVTVRGPASRSEITFSSTPALPEEELLARLLFGGSIAEISPTDALQLGAALSSLRGGGGGLDPINRLRRAIGLDRLRIMPADRSLDRGTAIALGKNLGRRFYVEIVTDGQGYNATELEFRVTGWLSLLAAIDTVGRGRAEAAVSRDY